MLRKFQHFVGIALVSWSAFAIELPPGFSAETLATNLNAATAIAPTPDGRIFIADQTGKILIWKSGALLPNPALSLHVTDFWERGLIGLALSPKFPNGPEIFVIYVTDRPFVHHVLSKFMVSGDMIDPGSEKVLLEGDDQATLGGGVPAGHQGGTLRFGNDGKLYVSLGEQTAGEASQRLNTLQGKILRLNADGSIPEDNPFLSETSGKYRSIFARGVRNSFGIGVQPAADGGRMFFTDVGGSAFEEVNELMPGANYGWPFAEGVSTNDRLKNPLHYYTPLVGQSIVGGAFVSAQNHWPEKWRRQFLFGDFMKHWIKALDPKSPTNVITFARGLNGPVATEWSADGSLLVLNRGAVWRDPKKFVPNAGTLIRIRYHRDAEGLSSSKAKAANAVSWKPALGLPTKFEELPRKLVGGDWGRRIKASEFHPFDTSSFEWHPLVSEKQGFVLPNGGKLRLTNGDIRFPPGTVFIRQFSVNSQGSITSSGTGSKLFETRLIVLGEPVGYGASYRWTTPEIGELIEDGELINVGPSKAWDSQKNQGMERSIDWWFPGLETGLVLPIVNPSYVIPIAATEYHVVRLKPEHDPLMRFVDRNLFKPRPTQKDLDAIPRSTYWVDDGGDLGARVRSYLQAHCAVCHQPGGASRGLFDARATTPLAQSGIIRGELAAGDLGIPEAKVIVPGSPEKSILLRRLKDTGFFRMPPVQYHNDPSPIIPVVEEWIRSMK